MGIGAGRHVSPYADTDGGEITEKTISPLMLTAEVLKILGVTPVPLPRIINEEEDLRGTQDFEL
jgi:hypothetical protein